MSEPRIIDRPEGMVVSGSTIMDYATVSKSTILDYGTMTAEEEEASEEQK